MRYRNGMLAVGVALALATVFTLFQGPYFVNPVALGVLAAGVLAAASDRARASAYFVPVVGGGFVLFAVYWTLFQRFSLWAVLLLLVGLGVLGWGYRQRGAR